jgi:hypothetical protein
MNIQALVAVATFALSLVIAYPMMSLAQSSSESQIEVPLNFTLKAKGGEKAKEGQENKTVTVDVTIQQGEGGSPTKVPVTVEVPNNTKLQDMQLCGKMTEGKQLCQSLKQFVSEKKGENESSTESSNEPAEGTEGNSTDGGN